MFSFKFPAVVLLAAVIIGTILGKYLIVSWWLIFSLASVALVYIVLCLLSFRRAYFIFGVSLLFIGLAWGNSAAKYNVFPANDIGGIAGSEQAVRLFGRIDGWPVLRQHRTLITCAVDSIAYRDSITAASGTVMITVARTTTEFSRGDYISFVGKVKPIESEGVTGLFDYSSYLKDKGIRGTVFVSNPVTILRLSHAENIFGSTIGAVRRWIVDCLYDNLSDVSAAVASGFLIGETHNIPEEIYQSFRRTGTMHLLAVSGSNVALVLLVVIAILRYIPLNRIVRFAILCGIIIAFSHLSYNQPSVVRASVMAIVVLYARVVYRRGDLNNLIAVAAVVLILYDPANLFDIGFQLSFAVTWGLVLFIPELNALIQSRRMSNAARYVLLIVFCSLVATLVASPITIYYFGEFSAVTILSNMIVVPLVSAAVVGIVILLLCALLYPPLAVIPGIALDRLLLVTNDIVTWFGHWDFASIAVPVIPLWSVFASLFFVTMLFYSIRYRFFRRMTVFGLLIGAIPLLGASALHTRDAAPEVIIDNSGATRLLVFNISDGLVVTEANYESRRDDFISRIFPYLMHRNGIIPRYYLFREPTYKINQRLDILTETFPDFHFIPVASCRDSIGGVLYEMTGAGESGRLPGGVSTDLNFFGDGLILASGKYKILASTLHSIEEMSELVSSENYSLLILNTNFRDETEDFTNIPSAKRVIILLCEPENIPMSLNDSILGSVPGVPSTCLVGSGECLRVPLEAID